MGFFSWKCKKCDHSIKSPYDIPKQWEYMNECVLVKPGGGVVMGQYDGYGRIDSYEITWESDKPELWHKRCWREDGSPQEFTGESEYAEDQGFFYDGPNDEEVDEDTLWD